MTGSPICTLAPATSPVVASIVGARERGARGCHPGRSAAEHDDPVAGERPGRRLAVGGDADAAAEHERVGGEVGVVEHGAGDRRQADLVAVVGDAVDDALADAARDGACRRGRRRRRCRRGPKQRMSVTAIGLWPAPITSRMTPPTPVLAPPNGSTADGWLWVSAFSASVTPVDERHDAGVADERRAHELGVDAVRGVAELAQQRRDRGPVVE